MTDTDRLDRLERIVLLATADVRTVAGDAEFGRLVDAIRHDNPAVHRSGGQLVLTPPM